MRWFGILALLLMGACEFGDPEIGSIEIVPGDTTLIAGTSLQLQVQARGCEG